jgi:SAM-dependent methyltransferase
MSETSQSAALDALPRLYRDLASWYPLLTPPADYASEAGFYRGMYELHCRRPLFTLLDLGSGGGHNAFHLKAGFALTLLDLSPEMLTLSRKLNPECEHVQGDMRSTRLGRQFDCILVHDAVSHMTSRDDLARVIETAYLHCAPGGVALFQPDFVRETFVAGVVTGGSDGAERALRYLEWRWDPETTDETYLTDMAYLLRDEAGKVEALHDRFVMGLFMRVTWMGLIAAAGFEADAIPFDHGGLAEAGHEVVLGRRGGHSA